MSKKLKGDEDIYAMEDDVSARAPPTVTLQAISDLLDRKFDERLAPVTALIAKIQADLGEFKVKMKDELDNMGLKLKTVDKELKNNTDKISSLEKQYQELKISEISRPTTTKPNPDSRCNWQCS